MFTITAMAVLFALAVSPEQAGPVAPQELTWLDDLPMEVPEAYAKPGRGGSSIEFGGVFVDDQMRLVPVGAGELQFVARRRIKLSGPLLAREVVRIYGGNGPGCCGGGEQAAPLQEITSKPFELRDGELINDVQPFAISLAPGEYMVSITIEVYEARDSDLKTWHPGAVTTRRFVVD